MIHSGALVHPTAIIHDTAIIYPGVIIGAHTLVEAYAVIGSEPEHKDFWNKPHKGVVIGKDCYIREHVTIQSGTTQDTVIGDRCNLLTRSYVAHDSFIEDDVVLSAGATLGGHVHVMRGANLGFNVSVHQRCVVGPYTMIGMNAVVTKKTPIEPFNIYVGSPARFLRVNKVGLDRSNLTDSQMEEVLHQYDIRRGAL